MWDNLPYRAAYSNGQNVCNQCQTEIATGSMQLAIMEQSMTDDCKVPMWYDLQCFFKIRRPATETLIDGYANLRYEHQMEIRKQLGNSLRAKKQPAKEESGNKPKPVQLPINDFYVEYARPGKGPCGCCQKTINVGEICVMKVSHMELRSDAWYHHGGWYHVACFTEHRIQFGWLLSGEKLPGFKRLKDKDKAELKQRIPSIENDDEPISKKMKKVYAEREADAAYQKQIGKQNRDYFDIRDKLNANTSKSDRVYILRAHNQFVPEDDTEILDHLTDVICFGAIKPCSQCIDGKFVFKNLSYCCTGCISAWSMCCNKVKNPERFAVNIPEALKAKMSLLNKKLKVRDRIIKGSTEISDDDLILHTKQPLFNMEFCIVGESKRSHDKIEEKIQQMGGKLVDFIHKSLTAIISNADELARMGKVMQMAKAYGIHVIPESILDDIKSDKDDDPVYLMNFHELSDWGKDLKKRIPLRELTVENRLSYATKLSRANNSNFKDGSIVDPDSGLASIAHVYWYGSLRYSVVLDLVDINTNKNSYFKMQLLESKTEQKYWLFESKGRIATAIGSNETKSYNDLNKARADFARLYLEKTGNHFGTAIFVKKPGKYNQMAIEYESENTLPSTIPSKQSKLGKPIHKLMELLFDVEIMKATLGTFDLDTDKMPLGKMSIETIEAAQKLLQEIDVLLTQTDDSSSAGIVTKSNEFYMRIPHKFGVQRPPKIDSQKMIRSKLEMLDALMQMATTYKVLAHNSHKTSQLEQFYQLNTDIDVLNEKSSEYEEILKYVRNTLTTNYLDSAMPELEVEEIFKISRHGEAARFKPHEKNTNRQLLWHGTKLINVVSILSKGLKDPYPGSSCSGGIFFTDALAKSIRYCYSLRDFDKKPSDTVLLFLCEVALGEYESRYRPSQGGSNLTGQCQSIKCPGRQYPSSFHTRSDGLKIPNGPLHTSPQPVQLPFNEFIVFDESQIKIRYLVRVKFD